MIPQETIEQVRQATDIVQIVGEYLRLKKRGRDMWANCPFHTEKTPSFKVSAERQLFHCFGCGKGGNVISFLMEHEKMSFVEAVKHLAMKAGVTIHEAKSDYQRDQTDRLHYAHEVAVGYYHRLIYDPQYKAVLNGYLIKRRGITSETIEQFQIGLSGESWDGLMNFALRKDLKVEELSKAGLLSKSEKRGTYFDRFRQRLMFPIYNLSQKPIAFGGRTLKKGEPAKYLNSPETALYNKSNVLYGLNFTKDYIRESQKVIVVEGYFDLISLWQVGIKNVVASSGTAFTPQQARLLARFAEEVYLFFDADSAGRQAALRSVGFLFDAGLEVKIIVAPSGEDPDSIALENGVKRIETLVDEAIDYIPFRVQDVDISKTGIIAREKLLKELAVLANKISDPTRRSLFIQDAAQRLQVDQQIFSSAIPAKVVEEEKRVDTHGKYDKHEFELLSLMLYSTDLIDMVFEEIGEDDITSPELNRLFSAMVTYYGKHGTLDSHLLIAQLRDQELTTLITKLDAYLWSTDETETSSEITALIHSLKVRRTKRLRDKLKKELVEAQQAGDGDAEIRILKEIEESGLYDA